MTSNTSLPHRGAARFFRARTGIAAALGLFLVGDPVLAACRDCGVVTQVNTVQREGKASGTGAVVGGVAGALIGNQFGKGNGKTAMTVIGAGGGAYAGHQAEKSMKKKTEWRVVVKMDNGEQKTLTYGSEPAIQQGDRVKLRNGKLALIAD